MAKSGIVKTPNPANKSWVELCDEDSFSNSDVDENVDKNIKVSPNSILEDTSIKNGVKEIKKECVKEIKKECDDSPDENTPTKLCNKVISKELISESKIKTEKDESPWRFSYATILKNSANISPSSPGMHTIDKVKMEPKTSQDLDVTEKSVKREIQREFLHDDLSLSSHLDVFHMQSPLKLESVDEEMNSPAKSDRETRAMKRQCSSKLTFSEQSTVPDDVLMPSPKKVSRLSSRRKREAGESPLTCKRSKQSSSRSYNTPKCVVPIIPPSEELETDEQVLMRRQKQIDYGKNTIGYERFCQMVPKERRHRKHPHTPPKHIKYSRRAWDGLIRQWRQQLHFWDPPSEGGGNIDDLDMSSMSEASSDTTSQASSLPPTPKDERKKISFTRVTRSSASESSSIAEDTGCSPLKDV